MTICRNIFNKKKYSRKVYQSTNAHNTISEVYLRVNFDYHVSSDFTCCLGVRQRECLSPLLFSIYLNDIEREFILKGAEGIDIGMLKLFLLLYADDIIYLQMLKKICN